MINRVCHLISTTSIQIKPFPIMKRLFIMTSFQYAYPIEREKYGEVAGSGLCEIDGHRRMQLPECIPYDINDR
jgi:hypothetical protein